MLGESRSWFTAAELAALALPGLPRSKRNMNERVDEEGWALRQSESGAPLSRRRQGRGGGQEYHFAALPSAARAELVRRGLVAAEQPVPVEAPHGSIWEWFERQSETVRDEARRRCDILDKVTAQELIGLPRSSAVATAAAMAGVSASSVWEWLRLAQSGAAEDRLALVAPRRKGGGREAEIDPSVWNLLLSDYLRPERPTFSSCYWRAKRFAEDQGIDMPHERSLRRKLEREVDRRVVVAKREGRRALMATIPPQQRTVAGLQAMELVCIDGHRWDVFVEWPDGVVERPIMVAISDIYSRKILAWRIGQTESALLTRLTFADLFASHGIPKGCLLDNGRAFASKWITGGAKTRFRFKIREDEPTGLLPALGVNPHWATPYSGQSKPIERAFRDLCDSVAKHPAFSGAYTGNRPDAKPENYRGRAVPLETFVRMVAVGIEQHNARPGRRTEMAAGRSFDETFATSYASAQIGKASPEQLRLALLTADEITTDRKSGCITLYGNRYWSEDLSRHAGAKVTVRFDPDDLTLDVHVYDRSGRYLCSAAMIAQTGFLDAAAAQLLARRRSQLRRATRQQEDALQLKAAAEIAALLPAEPEDAAPISPVVIRPVRHRGQTAAALKAAPAFAHDHQEQVSRHAVMDRFAAAATASHLRLIEEE